MPTWMWQLRMLAGGGAKPQEFCCDEQAEKGGASHLFGGRSIKDIVLGKMQICDCFWLESASWSSFSFKPRRGGFQNYGCIDLAMGTHNLHFSMGFGVQGGVTFSFPNSSIFVWGAYPLGCAERHCDSTDGRCHPRSQGLVEHPGFGAMTKRGPNGCLGYRRDELLTQIYRNYFIEYYKDPYFFTTVVFHGIRKGPRVFFGWLMKLVSLDVPATCRSFSWPWTTITMAL